MRVGILLTPYKEDQIVKQEFVKIIRKRDWLHNINKKDTIFKKNKKYVTDDRSIFQYLKEKYGNDHTFVEISGNDEKIKEKIKKCDIVFLLIFDLLEAFHILPERQFKLIKSAYSLPNVYPPYEYQFFINNKNVYYDYLRKKNINVLPFLYISSKDFKKNGETCVAKVMKMKRGDDGKFIGKPIYGQESLEFEIFPKNVRANKIEKYLERISKLYSGCVFQPYLKNFDSIGEYRVFYIGNKRVYCIHTRIENGVFTYTMENENTISGLKKVFEFAEKVFKELPIFFNGTIEINKLLTRIDITCCVENQDKFFVSELEFVPSLYCDRVDHLLVDKKLGEQIKTIIDQLPKKQKVNLSSDCEFVKDYK